MKSKIIAIAIALMLSLTACTSQNGGSSVSEVTTSSGVTETTELTEGETEAPTEPITEPITEVPTEAPKEELRLFSVPTSASVKGIDDILVKITESKGIEVTRTEENISFSATQSILSEIAKEYCAELEGENEANDDDHITQIEISDDYKTLEFYVDDGFENSMEALVLLFYIQPMSELQVLEGGSVDNVQYTQKIINVNTQEIISEATMPDDLNTGE